MRTKVFIPESPPFVNTFLANLKSFCYTAVKEHRRRTRRNTSWRKSHWSTGSSRGIGRAVATELARQGWAVCINYREREDCARSLVEQLTGEGCRVMAVQADVACREQVNTMVRQVEDAFGPVALLVNNAGVAGQSPISGHHR